MKKANKNKEANANTTNKVKTTVIVSILLLSVFTATTMLSVAQEEAPHVFWGDVTVNGAPADDGTTVVAKIGGEVRGSTTTIAGTYGVHSSFAVTGTSGDNISFYVAGIYATYDIFESMETTLLNLNVNDTISPEVTSPNATPSSIPADGSTGSQLNVTVTDNYNVSSVTVNLSAIGGDAAKAMTKIEGTDIYSTTTTAAVSTTPDTYNLSVNATDKSGISNTSVNIPLEVTIVGAAPSITSYAPETPVSDIEGASRTFNITINQTVTVSWQINGGTVETDTSVTEASYTKTNAVKGLNWNVSAIATNTTTGLSDMQTWWWTVEDVTAPASVTNMQNTTYQQTYINWTWTDPVDADFAKVMVYLDGTFMENVTKGTQFYNATTGLTNDTEYAIGTHTVDTSGNINQTWVNDSATTAPPLDVTPPASITNLQNTTYQQTYINWTWTDPADADFLHVMVYLNGTFKENVTKGTQLYNATGLTNDTAYEIGTRTVDTRGNINQTWVNHTASTKPPIQLMEGDVTMDMHVSLKDSVLIKMYLVGKTLSEDQLKCADTKDDSEVDLKDSTFIKQWLVDNTTPLWEAPADDDMLEPVP